MTLNFRYLCRKCSLIPLFLLFFQAPNAQEDFSALDEIVAAAQRSLKTDAALVVVGRDTVLHQKDSRLFQANRAQAPIGAASQWLTAALVLQAADEGKLSLDDKVGRYIPLFNSYMKSYLTLRHCLTHFTGIPSEAPKALRLFEKKKFASLEEAVNEYAKKPIQNNAGEVFRYSNIGPAIAARVVEIVYKKKFELLAQQRLFRLMGMRQTTFAQADASAADPADGARSTAGDMGRFMTMLLNNGVYKGQRVLSEEAVAELRKVQTTPDKIKYAPEAVKGAGFTLGAWTPATEGGASAPVLQAPSFGGTVAAVDFCRGYGFVFFLRELQEPKEMKTDVYGEVKEALDGKLEKTGCP